MSTNSTRGEGPSDRGTDSVWHVRDIARVLGVSPSHIHNEMDAGRLKYFRCGALKLVNDSDFAVYRGLAEPPPALERRPLSVPRKRRKVEPTEEVANDGEQAQAS
jgi:hypothetical protein